MNNRLKKVDEYKDSFLLASLTHDFKTSLNFMLSLIKSAL